jgi:hypothetical protein
MITICSVFLISIFLTQILMKKNLRNIYALGGEKLFYVFVYLYNSENVYSDDYSNSENFFSEFFFYHKIPCSGSDIECIVCRGVEKCGNLNFESFFENF